MLDLVQKDSDHPILIPVEFSAIDVGAKFTTERWMWEKIDQENAMALLELMGRSSAMTGSIFHFHPWSKVRLIESQ
jgi:hypothetical protein